MSSTNSNETQKSFLGLTPKEWVILLFPILFNVITIMLLQPAIAQHYYKIEIKNSVYKEFWEKSKKFNDVLIEESINSRKESKALDEIIEHFYDELSVMQQYYDTNVYDLEKFDNEFQLVLDSWDDFVQIIKSHGSLENEEDVEKLGNALEEVKETNMNLASAIRDEL